MSSLLIKIQRSRWYRTGLPPFIKKPDIPADCLADLNIQENSLSLWYIEHDKSNLRRVLTALAANCNFVSNVDYLLFDGTIVTTLGLKIEKTDGGTPDKLANRSWHHDLIELSGRKIVDLAHAIFFDSTTERIPKAKISVWLKEALERSELDASRLNAKLAAKVINGPISLPRRVGRMYREVFSSAKDAWQRFGEG